MRNHNKTALLLAAVMIAESVFLAGCGAGKAKAQEEYVKRASEPGMHEFYGVSVPVQDSYWAYSFNAEQLGDGEEWIDFEIKTGFPDVWELPAEYETKEIDGHEVYQYCNKEDTGGDVPMWTYGIMIPVPDEGKYISDYIALTSDFVEKKDKRKADKFFEHLMDGISFTEDEGHVIRTDYISIDGIRIPADGLTPSQFYNNLDGMEGQPGLWCLQIDFGKEDYEKGVEKILAGLEKEYAGDDEYRLLGSGPFENGGIEGGWYTSCETWSPEESDMMPHLTHTIMVPNDDLQLMMYFGYSFAANQEDNSIYDEQIKTLDAGIHSISAE